MLRLRDSTKNVIFKKSLHKSVKEGKLKIGPGEIIKREEKLYRRTKFKGKNNKAKVIRVDHLTRLSKYQRLNLKKYINTCLYKKKVLKNLLFTVEGLWNMFIIKGLPTLTFFHMMEESSTFNQLYKVAPKLRALDGVRYFFKKIRKSKRFLKASKGPKVRTLKSKSNLAQNSLQVKKRRAHVIKKLKKQRLTRRLLVILRAIETKEPHREHKLSKAKYKKNPKLFF